ncbi:helix-turn-helix transcriptional regulator [Thiocapsa sp. N5-Cardenillas]|uniref:helix-turn-helix transcriptional regulator n=1 Tax=Thiocapsa sp. N5-Cardenillas TaxID=3137397 RepID=UPI0035B4A9EF
MKTNWLRQLREQLNLTQDELTARLQVEGLDISRSTLASWESGRHSPQLLDASVRRALSRSLRVSPVLLLKMSGIELDENHTIWGERVAALVDQLPEDKQKLALRLV